MTPAVQSYLPKEALAGGDVISASRHATLQMTVWLIGGVLLTFVTSIQIRTADRFSIATGTLTLALWVIGLVGFGQTLLGRPQLAGFLSPDDPKIPALVHDIYGADTAHGLVAYGNWTIFRSGETSLFIPQAATYKYFGGFLNARHWAACVTVLLPMLLASCIHLAGYAGVGGWRTHGQTQQSWILWTVGLCMAGTASWMGDPVIVPSVLSLSLVVTLFWMSQDERKRAFILCMAYLVMMVGVCGSYLWFVGPPPFLERFQTWCSDGESLEAILRQHWLLGTGLGTTGDVWPMYRSHSAAVAHEGSSLLALAAEIGLRRHLDPRTDDSDCLCGLCLIYGRLDQDGRSRLPVHGVPWRGY